MTKDEETPLEIGGASHNEESSLLLADYGSVDDDGVVVKVNPGNSEIAEQLRRDFKVKIHNSSEDIDTASVSESNNDDDTYYMGVKVPTLRRLALELSLYFNLFITLIKLVAYLQTFSLSVLAALLDSVLDVVSQLVLNYTEQHSSLQRSSAHYPAGAARLEPIGVLTCAALMGMASFEVLRESFTSLIKHEESLAAAIASDGVGDDVSLISFWTMLAIVVTKLALLWLCKKAANKKPRRAGFVGSGSAKEVVQMADPTLEALAQDHWNDSLSNTIAAIALLFALREPSLWYLDPLGAILISFYIIHSWYMTGKDQIEQLTGKSAPEDFIEELMEIASSFDDRMEVDVCRAYHFGPKFLVELEVVMPRETLLFESHDLGSK
jgi:cation diffusion facilitator family transporter